MDSPTPAPHGHAWTFLTNHSHVLICLHRDPHVRLRDVADEVGITERAVQRIVHDLEEAGVIARHREGRRNYYVINHAAPLRHPVESRHTVGELLAMAADAAQRDHPEKIQQHPRHAANPVDPPR